MHEKEKEPTRLEDEKKNDDFIKIKKLGEEKGAYNFCIKDVALEKKA